MISRASNRFINTHVLVILLLTMISCILISERTIYPDVPQRMKIEASILGGTMEPPYQYRVMKPLIGNLLQSALSPFIEDEVLRHAFSYQVMIFFVFLGVYFLFYKFLRNFFTENTCILGLLLLQVLIPLGISSIWEEGDYITLLLYLVGLNLMFTGKEKFLPLVIAIGVFNRDQIIFILFLYVAYLFFNERIKDKKAFVNAVICVIVWVAGYLLLRNIFGFKESVYTIKHNVTTNINSWISIAELWIAMISVFAFLSIISYKRSNKFFRFALISLIPYVMIYFLLAIVSQLAKFLPAFLVMIPMSLQALTNEYTGYPLAETEKGQAQ